MNQGAFIVLTEIGVPVQMIRSMKVDFSKLAPKLGLEPQALEYAQSLDKELLKFMKDIPSMPEETLFFTLTAMVASCFNDGWRNAKIVTSSTLHLRLNPNITKS